MIGLLQKALTAMRHGGRAPFLMGLLARTRFDYAKEVGTGIDSSVVTAPVQWIQRAFPEARLSVVHDGEDREEHEGHELVSLVARPNPFYADAHLWAATLFSYLTAGNGYWVKVRNGARRVVELWYVPHWTMSPVWPQDGSIFISGYMYRPGAGQAPVPLEPDDVVHFRHGIDPRNPRLGISPLHGAIREIFTDLEGSNFVASLLRNMGVPGVVISPDRGVQAAPEDVEAVKKWFREAFGGDRRGDPLVMGAATRVEQYGFTPQQMDLSFVRNVAEERVCASLGIPAAVVGFGAGLEQTKVGATMSELRKLAWTNGVMPIQRAFADELQRSLLPDFRPHDQDVVEFDTSGVAALEEARETRAQTWTAMVQGGWAQVAEARQAMGLDVDDSHRIFLRPFSAIEVPAIPSGDGPPRPARDENDPEARGRQIDSKTKQDRRAASAQQRAYVRALERMERRLAGAFEPKLRSFFSALGAAAREAFDALPPEETGFASAGGTASKQEPGDGLLVARILEALGAEERQRAFRRVYEAHYLNVAEEVTKAGELVGLATDLPDPVARAVVQAGGRRSGLVDLSVQSRRALFDAIEEGRAAGEGAEQLAARIADHVESGAWQSAETRARVIARTETKFAQNTSTIERARYAGVQRFIVFDGRFGEPRSTPEHIARDGMIVTAEEAAQMAETEHPNGTLSFTPHFDEAGAGPGQES